MFLRTLCTLFICFVSAWCGEIPPDLRLWPADAPGSEGKTEKESWIDRGDGIQRVTTIHQPSIEAFLPPKETATGAAVVICPGGGHQYLAISLEGWGVARKLSSFGVAGFVLKSRLARAPGSTYKVEVESLQDAQRAIRTIRARASEWGIDPKRVGIIGFSAGAGIAALAATRYDAGKPDAADLIERQSSRPDFAILTYGGGAADTMKFTRETPPMFLVSAADDQRPTTNNLALFQALLSAGVPAELHIYSHGGHGFGMDGRPGTDFEKWPLAAWPGQLKAWLSDLGMLKKP